MKVLIGFDGSPSARAALARAIELFSAAKAELVLFGAFVRPMTSAAIAESAYDAARDEARAELKSAVKLVHDAGLPGHARFVEGDPREVLESVTAEERPDVVVLGARGQGPIAKLLLGSVSTYAVKHLGVPVLVVPHARHPRSSATA